jgi:pyruvate/2-oxoglutarate dehydrogenase complex dihydrolipoamide acyltransferase (E2) component
MRVPIEMPKLGYDMETGRIVFWLKAEGDRVARGEPIAEIETDKATIETDA